MCLVAGRRGLSQGNFCNYSIALVPCRSRSLLQLLDTEPLYFEAYVAAAARCVQRHGV